MAKVTTRRTETTFVLELDEAEALYIFSALRLVTPATDQFGDHGQDPIWTELGEALTSAGVDTLTTTARAL